ncbi:Similarity to tr/Q7NCK8/Q7NCK8 [Planktothrix tepida]|uniref:Similarity to tr/Q7NCK8/Q7NCK8 n=1 Tax=Planktothrix tepida PCC 9214 TaxID=671072 RepID=A0A1J1LH46_9CYAN
MQTKIIHKLGLTLTLVFSLAIPALGQRQMWLDQTTPQNWNKPGVNIPKTKLYPIPENCQKMIQPPRNTTERLITQAGWKLLNYKRTNGKTTLFLAISQTDIKCRLAESQIFVFHNGIFAGTGSPTTIIYRLDGAFRDFKLLTEKTFIVKFDRYRDSDASCCPSGSTIVNFKIDTVSGRPLVVPVKTNTRAFSDSDL